MLEVRGLCKTFNAGTPDEVVSLRGVGLRVEDASVVVVIGTNGSGKSTLLSAVAGTFPLDSGSIILDGIDVTSWLEHRRADLIGRVFQNPFSGTAPRMTVRENLAMATRRGRHWSLARAAPDSLAEQFRERAASLGMGLEDRLDSEMGTLSGGQRQALTLLMATWIKPRLLLLDEHTAALDPRSSEQVIRLTWEIVQRENLTTLMVTHSMQQAVRLGDRLLMMHKGSIVHDFSGADKKRLRATDLLDRFDDLRRADLLDPSTAEMLKETYV